MKKYLLLIVAVVTLSACEETIEPLKNPKASTNVVLLEAVKDTVPILIKDNAVYIFNEEGHVEYKINSIDPVDTFGAGLLFVVAIVLLFGIMIAISDSRY